MNKQDEILTVSPEQTYHAIRGSIVTAQHSVAKAVNSAMVTAYWEIGEQIYKACGENDRAEYGSRLLEYLSAKLTAEFGKGFSDTIPCAIIALATFMNPATLAPFT